MDTVSLVEAQAQLSQLIDRVAVGEAIAITRHGRPVALLTRPTEPLRPISLEALQAVTAAMPQQTESAESFIRAMRDEDRY